MGFALKLFYLCLAFCLWLISLALAQDVNEFAYYGFYRDPQLYRDGEASILGNGLLQLTNTESWGQQGHAFYPFPIKFNTSRESLSFATTFVFAIVPERPYSGGQGMAFVISPTMDLCNADSTYLGLFNSSSNGLSTNHILAVELDTVESPDFNETDGNHVGIDVNSVISVASAPAAYFFGKEGINKTVQLLSGDLTQIWIEYNGTKKSLNVTLAPATMRKPERPLLSKRIDLSRILSDTMFVGFSASTGLFRSNHYVLGWSFKKGGQATELHPSRLPRALPAKSSEGSNLKILIFILLPAVAIVLAQVGVTLLIVRKEKYEEVYEDWEREYGPQRFPYKDLYKATKGFSDKEVIGKGGFGKVYRGILPSSNIQVAIKKVSHDSKQGMKEFVAEVVSLGSLRHKNLVQLRGYCRRRGEFLLVYDYMPNGSLDNILYCKAKTNLNWFQRFYVIRGVASGLLYLHEEWEQVVLHRDIKPANILLDADLNGKLGDFGLARLYDHGSTLQTTKLVGTFGYMAPELMRTGKASTTTDVYAFGVSMLEVACGRRPIEQQGLPERVYLVGWVTDCWKRGAILDASDPRLEGLYVNEQMELVLKLGLCCTHPNPAARPSMKRVMQHLDGEVMLPDIPPEDVVIGLIAETKEALDSEASFLSMTRSSSAQTMSNIESFLTLGR